MIDRNDPKMAKNNSFLHLRGQKFLDNDRFCLLGLKMISNHCQNQKQNKNRFLGPIFRKDLALFVIYK